PTLVTSNLSSNQCFLNETVLMDPTGLDLAEGGWCNQPKCAGGAHGCPATLNFSSPDGKLKTKLSMPDGNQPVLELDTTMDLDLMVDLYYKLLFGLFEKSCTLEIFDKHFMSSSEDPIHLIINIRFGIDPTTGFLNVSLDTINFATLNLGSSGCG